MTINETANFLQICDLSNKSPLIEGLHGLGKSEIVRQYAITNNLHCEVLILSLMDTGDLCGLPRTVEIGGQLATTWSAPIWLTRIINAAWPEQLEYEELQFTDQNFKAFVETKLSRG